MNHIEAIRQRGNGMNRDDIIRMAREAGLWPAVTDVFPKELERFATLVAEHEREACAKVCEEEADRVAEHCALAIRGRKE